VRSVDFPRTTDRPTNQPPKSLNCLPNYLLTYVPTYLPTYTTTKQTSWCTVRLKKLRLNFHDSQNVIFPTEYLDIFRVTRKEIQVVCSTVDYDDLHKFQHPWESDPRGHQHTRTSGRPLQASHTDHSFASLKANG
jgi:hypothetical protein